MNNPHFEEKSHVFVAYEGEATYNQPNWVDVVGMEADTSHLEKGLIIVCLCVGSGSNNGNFGFRLVDGGGNPLSPYRVKSGNREPAHFSHQPNTYAGATSTVTYSLFAILPDKIKLQIRVDDSDIAFVNHLDPNMAYNNKAARNHMPISTLSVLDINELKSKQVRSDLEKKYTTNGAWFDMGGMVLDVSNINSGFILASISVCDDGGGQNIGFRFVNENNVPFTPYRTEVGACHFTHYPDYRYPETLSPMSYALQTNLRNSNKVKLQLRIDGYNDSQILMINMVAANADEIWNHMASSTMTLLYNE